MKRELISTRPVLYNPPCTLTTIRDVYLAVLVVTHNSPGIMCIIIIHIIPLWILCVYSDLYHPSVFFWGYYVFIEICTIPLFFRGYYVFIVPPLQFFQGSFPGECEFCCIMCHVYMQLFLQSIFCGS